MNNSRLTIESVSLSKSEVRDNTPHFQEREGELITIIDSLQKVQSTKEWSTLKSKIFDSVVGRLEKDLSYEAKKENPDTLKLNRLAGQLIWAERFSDLKKLEDSFRLELTNIRIQLYGKT